MEKKFKEEKKRLRDEANEKVRLLKKKKQKNFDLINEDLRFCVSVIVDIAHKFSFLVLKKILMLIPKNSCYKLMPIDKINNTIKTLCFTYLTCFLLDDC